MHPLSYNISVNLLEVEWSQKELKRWHKILKKENGNFRQVGTPLYEMHLEMEAILATLNLNLNIVSII